MAHKEKSVQVCGNGEFKHTPKKYSKKTEKKRPKKGKNQKKHSPKIKHKASQKSIVPKKKFCNTCTIFSILSGDFSFIRMIFFKLYGKGYFQYMYRQFTKYEIQRWVEDISQEVFISLYIKFLNGTVFKIKNKKAYIQQIIFNKSHDENSRIAKFISLDLLEYEKDSQA